MIIGINGKINSGKYTIGKIIQYLTCDYGIQGIRTFEECKGKIDNEGYGYSGFTRYNSEWQIKKFADKLKDIVCLLINCTREQLEDREFKEKELGEEWWFNHIIPEHGFESKLINWDKDLKPQKLTPRLLMQLIGTEYFRTIIHPNIWINSLMSEYKEAPQNVLKNEGYHLEDIFPNWVITDMRFPNELKAVKDRNGISIRVNRLNKELLNTDEKFNNEFNKYHHPSETALDNATFDYEINNDGTIEELIEKVKQILIKEKLIK